MESKVTRGTIDILNALKKDIKDPNFNRYLFLTYSLEEEALELLSNETPKDMRAIIYCNPAAYRKPKGHQSEKIKIENMKNHAKVYCLWGPKHIKCWTGSFNYTKEGLSNNIEWAASFEGQLSHSIDIDDFAEGRIRSKVSNNEMINQIINFVASAINNEDPITSDRVFQNKTTGNVLLHNLATNTLRKCIVKLAKRAEKNLTITYITPFVNKGGIENFTSLFRRKFELKDICLRILTNLPKTDYPGPFLDSKTISECKMKFKDFKILKRKKGKEGIFSKGQIEIGLYFIHMKMIHVSFLNMEGRQENHTIFTSANLTEEAWGKSVSKNSEIGIWIRDKLDNDTIHSFLEDFVAVFSEPDQQELDEIDDAFAKAESKRVFEEFWIEDLIKGRLSLKKNELRFCWSDYLPALENIRCTLCFRNIVTGERLLESSVPKKEGDVFVCNFETLTNKKNIILERIQLTFDTDLGPPLISIRKDALPTFTKLEGSKQYLIVPEDLPFNWSELVVNNQKIQKPASQKIELQKVGAIRSLLFMKRADKPSRISIFVDVQRQPHFSEDFFKTHAINRVDTELLGEVFEVAFETDCHVEPPFDTIRFQDKNQKVLNPIAVSKSETSCIYYFLAGEVGGLELTAMATSPYDRYFQNRETRLRFPVCSKTSSAAFPWKDAFSYRLTEVGSIQYPLEKLLSPSVKIEISVDRDLVRSLQCEIKYFFKEDTFTYRQPLLQDIKTPISDNEPYAKILCWGVLETSVAGKQVRLLGSPFSFIIRDSALKDFTVKEDIPSSLPFFEKGTNRLNKATNPIGWIVVDFENISFLEGYKIEPTMLELYVWRNTKRIEEIKFSLLNQGRKWFIPISQDDLDNPVHYIFILEIKDIAFSDFSAIFKTHSYRLTQTRSGLKFRRESPSPSDFPIKNDPTSILHGASFELEDISKSKYNGLGRDQREFFKIQGKRITVDITKVRNSLLCFTS